MKLLFCPTCYDIFKLSTKLRICKCGIVKGKYNGDEHTAVVNGKGMSLAINNRDVAIAYRMGHVWKATIHDKELSFGWRFFPCRILLNEILQKVGENLFTNTQGTEHPDAHQRGAPWSRLGPMQLSIRLEWIALPELSCTS